MYKFCKFRENRASDTPMWGVYIPKFSKILIKFSVFGVLYPYRCTDGGKIFPLPMQREKPQNHSPVNLNTGDLR